MKIDLTLESQDGREPLTFTVQKMINAGFTGRDRAAAQHHLDELAAEGIPIPDRIPVLYPVIRQTLLPGAEEIEVYSDLTCGEVEYVLLVENRDRVYVGLGSDHTDRKLEETDIPRAKQICPNVMSDRVWPLEEVSGHWDEMAMRLRQEQDGEEVPYQEGRLELMMAPGPLLDLVASRIPGPLDGYVIFSGTIGNLTGGFVYGRRVWAELEDPVMGRTLNLDYRVRPLDYLEDGS